MSPEVPSASPEGPDRTPPVVIIHDGPPFFTRASTLTLEVRADDGLKGSGIKTVGARIGSREAFGNLAADGFWHLELPALVSGNNRLVVWAEDHAGNIGFSTAASAESPGSVILDTSAPTGQLREEASYLDERGISFGRDAKGQMKWPVEWISASKSKVRVGAHIYKVRGRMAWGGQLPSAAVLEGPNPDNIPFLKVAVPFDSSTDSPISKLEYCLGSSCGEALRSAVAEPKAALFDIPIAGNNVKALAETSAGAVSLSVGIKVTDAAGNVGQRGLPTLTYHFVGAPIDVLPELSFEDPSAPSGLGQATWYTFGRRNMRAFYDGSTTPLVRYRHYVVRNPSPAWVRAELAVRGEYEVRQGWTHRVFSPVNGTITPAVRTFRVTPTPFVCSAEVFPCSGAGELAIYSDPATCGTHFPEDGSPGGPTSYRDTIVLQGAWNLPEGGSRTFVTEADEATGRATVSFEIPPATAKGPGYAEVDLARFNRTWSKSYPTSPPDLGLGIETPQYRMADGWAPTGALVPCCSGGLCSPYRGLRWVQEVTSGSERLHGTIEFIRTADRGDADPTSPLKLTVLQGVPFELTVTH